MPPQQPQLTDRLVMIQNSLLLNKQDMTMSGPALAAAKTMKHQSTGYAYTKESDREYQSEGLKAGTSMT